MVMKSAMRFAIVVKSQRGKKAHYHKKLIETNFEGQKLIETN